MPRRTLLFFASLAALAAMATVTGCSSELPGMRGIEFDIPIPAPDVELVDQFGSTFRLGDQRGKAVVLFFGYAHCPDVCPVTLSTWSRALPRLGKQVDSVTFAFVTVDPERDSAERLAQHMRIFDESFRALRGTDSQLDAAYKGFGVFRDEHKLAGSAAGYVVDHSTHMYLIDPAGNLRGTLPFDATVGDLVHDIQYLLDS